MAGLNSQFSASCLSTSRPQNSPDLGKTPVGETKGNTRSWGSRDRAAPGAQQQQGKSAGQGRAGGRSDTLSRPQRKFQRPEDRIERFLPKSVTKHETGNRDQNSKSIPVASERGQKKKKQNRWEEINKMSHNRRRGPQPEVLGLSVHCVSGKGLL